MAAGINNVEGYNKYGIKGKIPTSKGRQKWHLVNKEQRVYQPVREGFLKIGEEFTHLRMFSNQLPKHGIWEFLIGIHLVRVDRESFGEILDVFIPLPGFPLMVYSNQLGMHSKGAPIYAALISTKEGNNGIN